MRSLLVITIIIIIITTRDCESHFIRFHTETAGSSTVETLCGDSRHRVVTLPGPAVRIEFRLIVLTACSQVYSLCYHRSGAVQPPFIHNGFLADVKFVQVEKRKKKVEGDLEGQDKKSLKASNRKNSDRVIIQQDQGVPENPRPARVMEEVTRPSQLFASVTRPKKLHQSVTKHVQMFDLVTKHNNIFEAVTRPQKLLQSVTRPIQLVQSVTRPTQFLQSVTNPNQLLQSELTTSKMFQCRDEVTDPHRSGLIGSSPLQQSNETCSIVFRGEQRDLVMLMITSLHLSGENCSSSLVLSTKDISQPRGVRIVKKFCSPLSLSSHKLESLQERNFPIIINSSLVFLDFQTVNQSKDLFTGAFTFNNGG